MIQILNSLFLKRPNFNAKAQCVLDPNGYRLATLRPLVLVVAATPIQIV